MEENKEIWKKLYLSIKRNTSQIALLIPAISAIAITMAGYFNYMFDRGYYNYFGIDGKWLPPHNIITLYRFIKPLGIFLVYWAYTIFAARFWRLKGKWIWKIIFIVVLPFLINAITFWLAGINNFKIILMLSINYIPFHWPLIFAFGHCGVIIFDQELLKESSERIERNLKKIKVFFENKFKHKKEVRKNNKKSLLREKEYYIIIITLIIIGIDAMYYCVYRFNYEQAASERRFGIVTIDNESYAVIDVNDSKLILEACEIEDTTLKINKDTYLCIDNNINVYFNTFETVIVE